MRRSSVALLLSGLAIAAPAFAFADGQVRQTEVYFGDTHLHTSYSPDAYLMSNRSADPEFDPAKHAFPATI